MRRGTDALHCAGKRHDGEQGTAVGGAEGLKIGYHCHPLLSVAYPAGELCVPDIILEEQKGTHSICRHFRHLLAVKEV